MAVGPKKSAETDPAAKKQSTGSTEKKKRSKSFPTLALPDAVTIIQAAGEHGMEHSLTAFAKYSGHTSANSGPFKQKISSFKDWHLVSVNGDKVTITDSSRPLILRKDDTSMKRVIREAFLGCEIMKGFYEKAAIGVVYTVEDIKRHAVVDFEVSSESSPAFAKSIVASAVAAGLGKAGPSEGSVIFNADQAGGPQNEEHPEDDETETEHIQLPADRTRRESGGSRREVVEDASLAPVVLRQTWDTEHGSITFEIRSLTPLPAAAFAGIGKIVEETNSLGAELGLKAAESDDTSS